MIEMKLFQGKVVNTNDPKKKGRIQVRVLPELENNILVKEKDLPWFEPFFGNSSIELEKKELIKGSIVWIMIDAYWKKFFYLGYYNRDYFFDFEKVLTILNSISDIENKDYDNIRFSLLPDNSLTFHNVSTSESGIIYSTGSFILHKSDGSIYSYSVSDFKFFNDTTTFEISSFKVSLQTSEEVFLSSDNTIEIKSSGNMNIDSEGTMNVKSTGNMEIESTGNVVLKGLEVNITGGIMTVNGTVAPTGSGPFCAIPNCLFTNAPHIGTTVINT